MPDDDLPSVALRLALSSSKKADIREWIAASNLFRSPQAVVQSCGPSPAATPTGRDCARRCCRTPSNHSVFEEPVVGLGYSAFHDGGGYVLPGEKFLDVSEPDRNSRDSAQRRRSSEALAAEVKGLCAAEVRGIFETERPAPSIRSRPAILVRPHEIDVVGVFHCKPHPLERRCRRRRRRCPSGTLRSTTAPAAITAPAPITTPRSTPA
jgi:hypothetical protein